jgi:hypothetical protein
VLFVQNNIDNDAYDNERNAAKLDSIDIIPTHEIAENENNGADNHQNDAETLKKSFHNFCYSLFYFVVQNNALFSKLSNLFA